MSTSPLSPEDIRAAAEVHQELGPEYSDAVVAAFLEKVDREVAARIDARLASTSAEAPPASREDRRTLLKGIAIGACAGVLAVTVAVTGVVHRSGAPAHAMPASVHAREAPKLPQAPIPQAPAP